jgi:hypothetical protein
MFIFGNGSAIEIALAKASVAGLNEAPACVPSQKTRALSASTVQAVQSSSGLRWTLSTASALVMPRASMHDPRTTDLAAAARYPEGVCTL